MKGAVISAILNPGPVPGAMRGICRREMGSDGDSVARFLTGQDARLQNCGSRMGACRHRQSRTLRFKATFTMPNTAWHCCCGLLDAGRPPETGSSRISETPQAWASGAWFLMLNSVLELRPSAPRKELNIGRTSLSALARLFCIFGICGLEIPGRAVNALFAMP